jgi:hypothetical protein
MNEERRKEWADWAEFVLRELSRLNHCQEINQRDFMVKLENIRIQVEKLQVLFARLDTKSHIWWGALGGTIPVIVTIAGFWIKFYQ